MANLSYKHLPKLRRKREIFRVIEDGDRIMTTADPRKALEALEGLIEKHNVTWCWVDIEEVE